ncbi:MAG: magnesium chelatase subunit [Acidobacteriota bacterium]|jgi:magnesium chelatase subunit D|nr:magnesium chelatase subunit [Acidobacteriota bacterium]
MTSRKSSTPKSAPRTRAPAHAYPFTSIVGQDEMRLALLLSVIEPSVGGVLITGHRGTGKSTAVRALAELLPPFTRVAHCPFNCDPDNPEELCDSCHERFKTEGRLRRESVRVPVVDLPLNATEDRVCGSLNLERALQQGVRSFEPGLLARAHRGFLYIDEVNLLEDHLVDLLLDVAATGRNKVEREGISTEHAARFVLVGSSNPEEGELRPQLLDRFGLCAEVRTSENADERAEIVTRREAFDRDRAAFCESAEGEQVNLRRRLVRARRAALNVSVPPTLVRAIAELCARLGVDGHRGELTIARASRALAAFEGRKVATLEDARRVAALALRHRLRRDPFEQAGGGGQIEQAADEVFGAEDTKSSPSKKKGERAAMNSERAAMNNDRAASGDERPADEMGVRVDQRDGSHASRTPDEDGEGGLSRKTLSAPPAEFKSSFDLATGGRGVRRSKRSTFSARTQTHTASPENGRGRFFGEVTERRTARTVAFDATLREAAHRRTRNLSRAEGAPVVAVEDLRFKLFSRKTGMLYVFAVDASGSMAVNRIGQAKSALGMLLRRSYVRRDRVALVSFRETRGEILLRPSRSPALAKRLLDALPVGGATPLASGLLCAQGIIERARREGAGRIALLVFTDGRANVPLESIDGGDRVSRTRRIKLEIELIGERLRRAGVETVVVNTRTRFVGDEEGKQLARSLGGSYTRLPFAALPASPR